MSYDKEIILNCPVPISGYSQIQLAHGGGGKLMNQLINKMFIHELSNEYLDKRHDSSVLNLEGEKIAYTTDSYVVHPLFFPGGDIGSMAIYGTVNDLAMSGARPKYLSLAFIIEEGFGMDVLQKIVSSIRCAAEATGVKIVTGDTKVVDKNKGDGLYINTSGIGIVEHNLEISPKSIKPDDAIIVSGDIARHGICIMAKREGLEFESDIQSDLCPVWNMVKSLLDSGIEIHCLRDLTRGGLSSALNELAQECNYQMTVNEKVIPVREGVKGACEMLGLDPFYVACEGRFVCFVPDREKDKALEVIKRCKHGKDASIIGSVGNTRGSQVFIKSIIGVERILDMISGQQLPRIC